MIALLFYLFVSLSECNAHVNACVTTVWQEWTYNWNPCAAEVSLHNYGLYLFGYRELENYGSDWAMYNLYRQPSPGEITIFESDRCQKVYNYCVAQLAVAKAHTEACYVTLDYLKPQVTDEMLFVARRSWLALTMGW